MRVFVLILLLLIPGVVAVERMVEIELVYVDGQLSHRSLESTLADTLVTNSPGEWVAEVQDDKGSVVHVEFFDMGLDAVYESGDELAVINLGESQLSLYVPYVESASQIVFYNPSIQEIYRIDVLDVQPTGAVAIPSTQTMGTAHETKNPRAQIGIMVIVLAVILGLVAFIMMTGARKK